MICACGIAFDNNQRPDISGIEAHEGRLQVSGCGHRNPGGSEDYKVGIEARVVGLRIIISLVH